MKILLPICLLPAVLAGCKVLHQAASYNLKTGNYEAVDNKGHHSKVYIVQQDDSVRAYTLTSNKGFLTADSVHFITYDFPSVSKKYQQPQRFVQKGLDVDIISVVFKLRPSTTALPAQLNTNFNAAAYFGYRWDDYKISYRKDPLKRYHKQSHHFAYGAGIFTGIGSTAMNEYVTIPAIDHQYEGVVIAKGITGIVGIGHFSFGVAVGSDNLIGEHKKQWVYNNKLWTGITVGLNLN